MMNFKRFTVAVSVGLSLWSSAQACVDWTDPTTYNLFRCVEPLPDIHKGRLNESVRFWTQYSGKSADELGWAVEYMPLRLFEEQSYEYNALLAALQEQGKREAIDLLRLNATLDDLVSASSRWSYRKVTSADYLKLLDEIDQLRLTGDLARRKTFLKMRCLFRLKDYDSCMELWNRFASKWPESPLRQRMEGYVAGCLYQQKEYTKAIDYYFRLGDDESIQLCVNRLLHTTDLEQEYQRDPNSRILGYVLEDYANYYYHAIANQYNGDQSEKIWYAVTRESGKMEQFALRVAKEGKVKDPQMWQAFAGFIQMFRGQNDKAYATFCQAEKMPARGIVAPLIRHYKLMAALEGHDGTPGFDQYLAGEIAYYKNGVASGTVEYNVLYNLYEYELDRRIVSHLDKRDDATLPKFFAQATYDPYSIQRLDRELSTEQVREIRRIKLEGSNDPLIKGLLPVCDLSLDRLNETLGTKLLREARYDDAVACFGQVSQKYIDGQGIAPYLAARKLKERPFMRTTYAEVESGAPGTNVKLAYCQELSRLQKQLDATTGDARARVAIDLANRLYQASPAGDLWAISEYSWSCYGPYHNELNDLAGQVLRQGLAAAQGYESRALCYFGLAANPIDEKPADLSRDPETGKNQVYCHGAQLEAYQWLNSQPNRTSPVYATCDWIKCYAVEK